MDGLRIVIASKGRHNIILKKTLRLLKDYDIDLDCVDILLGSPAEEPEYRLALQGIYDKDFIFHYESELMGIVNFIRHYYKYETDVKYLLRLDDDLDGIIGLERKPISSLKFMIEYMFRYTEKQGYNFWGIGSVPNPFFMKDNITTNLKYIAGCFNGEIIDRSKEDIQVEFSQFEDVAMCCEFYLRDGGIVRNNACAVKTKWFGDGGMNLCHGGLEKRNKLADRCAPLVKERYGDMVTIVQKETRLDVRLNGYWKPT